VIQRTSKPFFFRHSERTMPKQHNYILGMNTYDHDVSVCLLRDGAIAWAIMKERVNRQ
jgi:carbamoyltransferase